MDINGELNDLQQLITLGELDSAKRKYRVIADRMQCSAEEEEQLLLEFFKAQILAGEEDYSRAVDLAENLLGRFRALNLRDKAARCHLLLSGLLLRTGDYEAAKAHAEAVVYFTAWEMDDPALKGDAQNNLGLALKDLGCWIQAEGHFREAVAAYSCLRDTLRKLRASLNLAILLRKMGKIAEAGDICRDGLRRAKEKAIPIGICRYALELANIAVMEQDPGEAREYLALARETAESHGYKRDGILAVEIEGDLAMVCRDRDGALERYLTGLDLARALAPDGDLEAGLLRRAAGVFAEMDKIADGRRLVDRALVLTEKTQDAYEHGICLRVLGELELAGGMEGSGLSHLQDSVRELADLSPWCHQLALSDLILGSVLLERTGQASAASATQHLLDARRIYSNLGISAAVRTLDELIFSSVAIGKAAAMGTPSDRDVQVTSRHHVDPGIYGIVTEDERMIGDLERWGPTEARVLIEGETGVGKELMARALHAMGRRREGPFVVVDCGALSETLADSELLGHAKGAFTGAIKGRTGLVEGADGGTLFLDEIGELDEGLQVKLLRMLENGVVRRVGENVPRSVDVRVISATARNLREEVEAGRFRRDLYYRLKTVLIRVPSLEERTHDVNLLLDHYLRIYMERHGRRVELSGEARAELMRYQWPGNVRELKNVIEALVLSGREGETITPARAVQFLTDISLDVGLKSKIADLEHEEIMRVMKICKGNKTKAAKMLGISRKTLWQKLRQRNRTD